MKKILLALIVAIPSLANANVVSGVFQTAPGDSGGFLHVQMGACADNAEQTCGTVLRAYKADGSNDGAYEHLGKTMVWAMDDKGNGKWSNGKIWDPSKDKTYKSKMELNGDMLTVEGCIAFICRGQVWQRFE